MGGLIEEHSFRKLLLKKKKGKEVKPEHTANVSKAYSFLHNLFACDASKVKHTPASKRDRN